MSKNTDPKQIIIGCDHAAYQLKEKIKKFLVSENYSVQDVGTDSEKSVDYPDFAIKVASKVSTGIFAHGILLCGTGIGMSIAANKFPNVRAALCHDLFSAEMSKQHNDANILVMGARTIDPDLSIELVMKWLQTSFEGGRHQRRLDQITGITR